MAMLTREEKVQEITRLEIEISKLEQQQGCRYGDLFPKILKLTHKLQKIRNSL